jgi:hypothetical protein
MTPDLHVAIVLDRHSRYEQSASIRREQLGVMARVRRWFARGQVTSTTSPGLFGDGAIGLGVNRRVRCR